ncbi:YbjQ family protein [Hymenobacter weizhouensis]|uniref:YbjQ family protein n=1 Tax=Hymenobacter sp. YIM 151500-1 TaxID=2987689 RepID=UPI002226D903|nr:heavy metal-binding domain-containing protein [Hymenobacter sp. YIM 151500-1]UYZ63967.1 heavy metal-binding domain-containing protein [Hymenobacter sp. YIM 151500-1]
MPVCPNCESELKDSFFGSNYPLNDHAKEFIHTFTNSKAEGYCEKCGKPLIEQGRNAAKAKHQQLSATLNQNIHHVPLLSLQAPTNWKFYPLGMVTGQSVTGTGVFSEFASSWTDFFGAQSKAYNQKIAGGESICQTQLRLKCIELGGNAILGTDIDYAEVGGQKGMLMVCMSGTAVMLENTDVMGPETIDALNLLTETAKNRRAIRRFSGIIDNDLNVKLTRELGIS